MKRRRDERKKEEGREGGREGGRVREAAASETEADKRNKRPSYYTDDQ